MLPRGLFEVTTRPEIQSTNEEFLAHCGTVCLPARQRKPRDKGTVEAAVRFAQRWTLAKMRKQVFHSLAELNDRIRELVTEPGYGPQALRELRQAGAQAAAQ